VNRDREVLEIKRKARGLWAKTPFFFPPIQNRGRARVASASGGRRRPGGQRRTGIGEPWGSAAAGDRGKQRGGSMGSQPCAHLVLWWLVEAAPRATACGGGGEQRWCDVGRGREREMAGSAG
jgi:hypothetical protein